MNDQSTTATKRRPFWSLILYFLLGCLFGVTLTRAEVISWFRMQEMFRFQSPRMYLIITSAILVAASSLAIIKRFHVHAIGGSAISVPPKTLGKGLRYIIGGFIFGIGWAFTGACPGPLFALIGNGVTVILASLLSALAGTYTYALLRSKLPH